MIITINYGYGWMASNGWFKYDYEYEYSWLVTTNG